MEVRPIANSYELLLTAQTPVSHHDPAIQDDSNRMMFNRQKQILARSVAQEVASPELMARLAATHIVPADVADVCKALTFPEFLAVVLVRLWLDMYNSMDGVGLFEGMERYERLETRIRQSAIPSMTLRAWWDRLCVHMCVPIHGGAHDAMLYDLLSAPAGTQRQVLAVFLSDFRSAVAIARLWHTAVKLESEAYAEKAGQYAIVMPKVALQFGEQSPLVAEAQILEVPAVSANSLRHQVVREPAWVHLMGRLGLASAEPGKGPVPSGAEAIFYNGGNIEAGAKQPSNIFSLARQIRAAYPSLDLLGGVTDSFDIGESRLHVAGWVVCAENREALRGSPAYDLPNAQLSVFDMMDDVTLTRHAGVNGLGQMIYTFETLAAGVQVVCRMVLSPYTPALSQGALIAACETFLDADNTIGGQAARGFGHCRGEWLARGDETAGLREAYEAYLDEHKDALIEGLVSGKMGTGSVVLT